MRRSGDRKNLGSQEPGSQEWGASVARCPPNRVYRNLRCDCECLMIVIGTCDMVR